jgi:tetratricopeptide (TPR) repeat protein
MASRLYLRSSNALRLRKYSSPSFADSAVSVLEKVAAEQREKERLTAERLAAEQRVEAEQREKERLEVERLEKERLEAEQREKERLEAGQREKERLEAGQREKERLEAEQREKERLEAEQREKERLEAKRREKERLETERRELQEKRRLKAAEVWSVAKKRPILIIGSIALLWVIVLWITIPPRLAPVRGVVALRPTPIPALTPTQTPQAALTPKPTPTPTPQSTPTPESTPTPTPQFTPTSTATASPISSDPAYYIDSGRLYRDRGDYDKAISDFNDAIRLNPNAKPYNNHGNVYSDKEITTRRSPTTPRRSG